MSAGGAGCPRCGAAAAASQEYCLECGLRLPRAGRFGPPPTAERRLVLPLLVTLAVAAGGGVAAAVLSRDRGAEPPPVVATGGSVVPAAAAAASGLAAWPSGTDAWSIVLASVPKAQGWPPARAIADEARQRGLPRVGILDSDRHSGLHPGYWLVFSGVYATEPEATGALQRARTVAKTARVQRVAG